MSNFCSDGDWIVLFCSNFDDSNLDSAHPDFIPADEIRVAAVNTVGNCHKFLQIPDEKFAPKDVTDIKAKDKKVVGLFEDGQVIVWDLISGVIVYQFDSEIRRLDSGSSGFIQSFSPSCDEIILNQHFNYSETENELSVWRRSSQPERFRDTRIKSSDLEYANEHNLAIMFGQFARPVDNQKDRSEPLVLKIRSLDDPHLEESSRSLEVPHLKAVRLAWHLAFFSPTLIIFEIDFHNYQEKGNHTVAPILVFDFLNLKQFLVGQT
jgi:hypothetical protein